MESKAFIEWLGPSNTLSSSPVSEVAIRGRAACYTASRLCLSLAASAFALTPAEAAASIGSGVDFFNEYVRPHLRLIRRGRKVLIPCSELQRWVDENAQQTLAETDLERPTVSYHPSRKKAARRGRANAPDEPDQEERVPPDG